MLLQRDAPLVEREALRADVLDLLPPSASHPTQTQLLHTAKPRPMLLMEGGAGRARCCDGRGAAGRAVRASDRPAWDALVELVQRRLDPRQLGLERRELHGIGRRAQAG